MTKRRRLPQEIDIDILRKLNREPKGIPITRLALLVRIPVSGRGHFSRLEKEGSIRIEEIRQNASPGRGRRLLSKNPKTYSRRIIKITEKGKLLLNKSILKSGQANYLGFFIFSIDSESIWQ